MNLARLKWLVLMLACAVTSYGILRYHSNTIRESLTSARVYWRADQAIITVTTAAEVRSEDAFEKGIRVLSGWAKLGDIRPDIRVGAAHVFTFQNGSWRDQRVTPILSPKDFALWPYDGHLYTWDESQAVREWNGRGFLTVAPQRAAELYSAFPHDPNNYLPAGAGASPQPYDIVQDVITRDEWHAYQKIALLPDGRKLAFPVGNKTFEIAVQRNPAGELSLTVTEGGKLFPLWQAQPKALSLTTWQMAHYRNATLLSPGQASAPGRKLLLRIVGSLLTLLLVWSIFLRPALLATAPPAPEFDDASVDDYPELDRTRWDELSASIEALGFVRVRDFKLRNLFNVKNISRLYLNPKSNCYASLFQMFSPKAPKGLRVGYTSYLGEDWTIGHGDGKPISGNAITRTKHKLSFNRPGLSLEEIYSEHIAMRDKVARELGLAIVTPQGFETYQERSTQEAQARRDVIRKTNPIKMALKVYWARIRPLPNDWLGDYPKEMEARTGQKFVASEG